MKLSNILENQLAVLL